MVPGHEPPEWTQDGPPFSQAPDKERVSLAVLELVCATDVSDTDTLRKTADTGKTGLRERLPKANLGGANVPD